MNQVATKLYYGVRAIVLMPSMMALGLGLMLYDKLRERPRKPKAQRDQETAQRVDK